MIDIDIIQRPLGYSYRGCLQRDELQRLAHEGRSGQVSRGVDHQFIHTRICNMYVPLMPEKQARTTGEKSDIFSVVRALNVDCNKEGPEHLNST